MDDAALVGERQSGEHIDHDVQLRLQRERLTHLQQLLQVDPVDELHGDVQVAVQIAEVVNADDVRMLERCGGLRLVQESLSQIVLPRDRFVHDLDRDGAVEHGIPGFVHDPHCTFAHQLEDAVFADIRDLSLGHAYSLRSREY